MELEDLAKRIDNNANKIENNLEKIQKNSYAIEILGDYKKSNQRLFTIILVILTMWFLTIGYLVYVLNDVGTEEITETYDVDQSIEDMDSMGDNTINNG